MASSLESIKLALRVCVYTLFVAAADCVSHMHFCGSREATMSMFVIMSTMFELVIAPGHRGARYAWLLAAATMTGALGLLALRYIDVLKTVWGA